MANSSLISCHGWISVCQAHKNIFGFFLRAKFKIVQRRRFSHKDKQFFQEQRAHWVRRIQIETGEQSYPIKRPLMSGIDLVSKNLACKLFFCNFSKKDLKKTAIRNCIEEIANVSKIPKVRRIFLLCKKIAGITNFSKFYFYKEKRPWRASWSPQISQKSNK